MKIYSQTPIQNSQRIHNKNNACAGLYYSQSKDTVSFTSNKNESVSLKKERFFNKLLKRKLCDCNPQKLEGAQDGLKTFEGLSMKQITYALTDLHSINMVSGCTRHCLHCYANAQPTVNRGSYEDLKLICDDIKELEKRTGAKSCHHHGKGYLDISFDADAMDCHLFDKDGNKHDYVDIAKLVYESTGYKPVFDTNGWNTKEKQKVAEDYVQKLIKDDNYKNFHQINVSINPFNPKYVKAIKSGYDVDSLYMPFKKVVLNPDVPNPEDSLSEDFKTARNLYTGYVKQVANTLITMKPLLKCDNFSMIIRALGNDMTNMKGFRVDDFGKTIGHIYSELNIAALMGEVSEEELMLYRQKLEKMSTYMFSSGRMEKFYKVSNNGSLEGIEKIDLQREESKARVERIKSTNKLSSAKLRYLKMIAPDGKVYAYDNYAVIPTDIQFKTSVKDSNKPFKIKTEDWVLTEDMIDFF